LVPSEEEATDIQFLEWEEALTTQVNPEFVLVQMYPPFTAATSSTRSMRRRQHTSIAIQSWYKPLGTALPALLMAAQRTFLH